MADADKPKDSPDEEKRETAPEEDTGQASTPRMANEPDDSDGDTVTTGDDTVDAGPSSDPLMPGPDGEVADPAPEDADETDPTSQEAQDEARADDDGMIAHDYGDHSAPPVEDGAAAQDTVTAGTENDATADTVVGSVHADDTVTDDRGEAAVAAGTGGPLVQEKIIERRGGFVPAVFGGILAAVGGFFLSQYLGPTGWPFSGAANFEEETRSALMETRDGMQALQGRVDGVETNLSDVDLSSVETAVADLTERTGTLAADIATLQSDVGEIGTGLNERVDALSSSVEGLQAGLATISEDAASFADRVSALEKAPMEDAVSPETVAAYEAELADLQSRMDEQSGAFDQTVADQRAAMEQAFADQQARMDEAFAQQQAQIEEQRAELQAMVDEANASEQEAARQAQIATLRAAVSDLDTAVRSGEPFQQALGPISDSEGMEVPEALSANAEDGVATQARLAESFPPAARDGLAAARADEPIEGEGANRFASFMARQLGARSVTPREGDSPDAILSRAEAALDNGDLGTALSELEALPDTAREAMSGWIDQARARADALSAVDALRQDLNIE